MCNRSIIARIFKKGVNVETTLLMAFAFGAVFGWVIPMLWWWFFWRPKATMEFAPPVPGESPRLFLQLVRGGKIAFFNNDTEVDRTLEISFDAGALEPGQPDVEADNKLSVEQGKTKTVVINRNAEPGQVFTYTWSATDVPVAPGSRVIIQGGP